MTLDEAVTYFTEEAELRKRMSQLDGSFVTETRNEQAKRIHTEAAKNNRQLAEWLMELKDLRAEQNDQYVFIHELMSELKEAKRLLKLAVEDMNSNDICDDVNKCNVCTEKNCFPCDAFH